MSTQQQNLGISILKPQAVSSAGDITSNIFTLLEGQFNICTQTTATAGTIVVKQIEVSAASNMASATVYDASDLERMIADDLSSATNALTQTLQTGAASPADIAVKGVISRIGFNNPEADKNYYRVTWTVGGSPANMVVSAHAEVYTFFKPAIQFYIP